ncbi:MAG: hypothetical protein K2Q25_09605 [Mycobacteriaceae bacterium]|nr:hypothetical protein [Mycobacteriaceae bacterium]
MKLARPDIPHPRIVLAGSPGNEEAGLIPALRQRGLHARWLPWDDPAAVDADLVIVRAVTDYRDRLDEFLGWTRRVPYLLNSPDVIAWNADQEYLGDLARAGIPTLPGHGAQTVLIFLGGEQSHALAGSSATEPDYELWDLGYAALQAAAEQVGVRRSDLLFARVDLVGDPAAVRLTGLDLIAPELGWRYLGTAMREAAQRRFALCVESALDQLGLGPLSQ